MPVNNFKNVLRHHITFASSFINLLGLGVLTTSAVHADTLLDEPLALSDRSPLVQRFNLPVTRSAELIASSAVQWRFGIDLANNFVRDDEDDENLVLDGESQRYELGVRYGIGSQWEVGITVPWIAYNGGALDNFIDGWHDVWGLPDADRPDYATDQLQFLYQRDGRTELNFEDAEAGFGDVQLQIANQLMQTTRDSVTLIATLNLPTGDEDKLTGSGGTSAGIALAATHAFTAPWTFTANVGALSLPSSDVLDAQQKSSIWFAAGELAWAVAADWRLRAQLEVHSALYDSELSSLGDNSCQLLLGGSVRLAPRWVFEASIAEDIAVDTAPDVTFQIALKTQY